MADLDDPGDIPDFIVENAKVLAIAFAREDAVVVVCQDAQGNPVYALGCINKEERDGEWYSTFAPFARMYDTAEEVDQLQLPQLPPINALHRRPKMTGRYPSEDARHRERARILAEQAEAKRRSLTLGESE